MFTTQPTTTDLAKQIALKHYLIKEMDSAARQLSLYKLNKEGYRDLPVKLANKIAYLRSYSQAIVNMEQYKKDGTLEQLLKDIKNELRL